MKKKKTIKINFQNFYGGFNPNKNFFIDALKKKYDVVLSDNPDYLFYSVYASSSPKKNLYKKGDFIRKISPTLYVFLKKIYSKLFGGSHKGIMHPSGNFVKILYSAENTFPDMSKCDWALSSYPEKMVNHPNYIRIPYHRITDYPFQSQTELPWKRKINLCKIKKEKTHFCNFIYSQDIISRNGFFKKINRYKEVDAPGRCMNNMEAISEKTPRSSRLSKNWAKEKLNFIKKYKFTIAYENTISPGWITEKLTHPLLVNSIPIYVGTKTVENDFNPKCFVNCNDFKNTGELIEHIKKIDNDDKIYERYLKEPIFKNKKQRSFSTSKYIEKKIQKIIFTEEKKRGI